MNVKKFIAPTSREALRKLRDAMGPDAVIISNRSVGGQVEILALASEEMAGLDKVGDVTVEPVPEAKFEIEEIPNVSPILESQAKLATKKKQVEPTRPSAKKLPEPIKKIEPTLEAQPIQVAAPKQIELAGAAELMAELRTMRSMMETQLAEITWGNAQRKEPHKAQVLKEMLATGFSASLARHLIENMPKASNLEQGMTWVKSILAKNINTISCDSDMLEKGGVFALVGPTGVGKTTTTAKLAARCVMRHGANKLALITTDGYRIGGYEQLRIYGKILGVMVHAVKDEADLKIALSELKNKHTVLIDTVGMSQRDQLVSAQVAMLANANVNKLLCLNATSTGETIAEVIHSYQGAGLSGCIITKMDEAASLGAVLDAIIRQKLTMFYLANGQRVPEDLHVANRNYLVDHAFKLKRNLQAFQLKDDELPMLIGNTVPAKKDRQLSGVSLG